MDSNHPIFDFGLLLGPMSDLHRRKSPPVSLQKQKAIEAVEGIRRAHLSSVRELERQKARQLRREARDLLHERHRDLLFPPELKAKGHFRSAVSSDSSDESSDDSSEWNEMNVELLNEKWSRVPSLFPVAAV